MVRIVDEKTFTLNPLDCNPNSYQTWVTVRLKSDGLMERKSNDAGNGVVWVPFGFAGFGETDGRTDERVTVSLFYPESEAARLFATVAKLDGYDVNAAGFGSFWRDAKALDPVTNRRTGRKLTAAPSILAGRPPRDKNVKRKRWNGSLSAMLAERDARKRMETEAKPL